MTSVVVCIEYGKHFHRLQMALVRARVKHTISRRTDDSRLRIVEVHDITMVKVKNMIKGANGDSAARDAVRWIANGPIG